MWELQNTNFNVNQVTLLFGQFKGDALLADNVFMTFNEAFKMCNCEVCDNQIDIRNDNGLWSNKGFVCGNCCSANTAEELQEDHDIILEDE